MTLVSDDLMGSTPLVDTASANKPMGRLLTTEQAAEVLTVSTKVLQKWRTLGRGPRFICLSKAVRYTEGDLCTFIEQSRVSKTAGRRRRRSPNGDEGAIATHLTRTA